MAQNSTYTRRINLYINGTEVKNDVSSIKKEMMKLVTAQSKMAIGSREYIAAGQKIQSLNAILKQHRSQLNSTANSWSGLSRVTDSFNKYFGLITTGIASLTGVAMGFRKAADAYNEFEEKLDNLSALTGLEGKDLEWLGDQAKAMSVKTTEAGIKIKQSATDIEDAFTMIGSQRPELLKNKEALAAVTEDAIILSEAAKDKLEPSAGALTNTMNQFNMSADESRRVINVLAAGSKEGAANIPYLSQAIEKMGTSFNLMGGEVEEAVGMIEAAAPKFKEASLAGNSLDKVLLKMKAEQIGYKDGVFSINLALQELEARFKAGESSADIFGVEHAKMVDVLVQSRSEVNRYTEAVTGTNVAIEQANKNTNNRATELAQAKNRVTLLAIELGEKLSPALTKSVVGFSSFLKLAIQLPEFIKENQTLLIALAGALLTYNAGLISSTALQIKDKTVRIASMAIEKSQMALRAAQVIGLRAWIAITGQATVAQKRWIISMKQMGVAMSVNPIGAVIAGLTALYLALKAYDKYNAGAIKREKEKKAALEDLTEANEILKKSYEDISIQISQLSSMSIQERQDLQNKIDKTLELAEAELLLQEAKQEDIRKSNSQVTSWQFVKNAILSGGEASSAAASMLTDAMKNGEEAASSMYEGIENLRSQISALKNQQSNIGEILNAEELGDKIGIETLANLEEKLSKYQLALKYAAKGGEDYLRIQSKITEVQKEMDKYSPEVETKGDKNAEKEAKKLASAKEKAEKQLADKITEIRRQLHLDTLSDEAQELQAIKDKYADLYATAEQYGIDTSELEELYNQEIEAKQKEHNQNRIKLRQEVQEKLADMYMSDFDKEKKAKLQQYEELLRLAEENGLASSEYYQMLMQDIEELRNSEEPVDIFGMTQEDWESLMENMQLAYQYIDQLGSAWSSYNSILTNIEDKELSAYEDNIDAKKELLEEQLDEGLISQNDYNDAVEALDEELDAKETELAIKQAKRDKALAMFQAGINTASAVVEALPNIPLSIAIAAAGAIQIAAIASEPLPEYATGGFTNGDRIYRAGEEGTEWIAPNDMVTDPYTGPVIADLEAIRKGKTPASIFGGVTPDFEAMQEVKAYADGGLTNASESPTFNVSSSNNSAIISALQTMITQNQSLINYLSDPANRQAYITNTSLMDKAKEDAERASMISIK
jgi:TP901 family phage tail tape measure protein